MTYLTILLLIKIIGTLLAIGIPFLFFPKAKLDELAGLGAPAVTLYRLYGVAVLALLVAYTGGVLDAQAGRFPGGIVAMGIVSNAGAVAAIVCTGRAQQMTVSVAYFGAIAAGLVVAAISPPLALTTVW